MDMIDKLEMAIAREQFEMQYQVTMKRQSVSQLKLDVSSYQAKNVEMEEELTRREEEIKKISENNKRMESDIKGFKEAAPKAMKLIKILEKDVQAKRKEVENEGKRLTAIVEENRALVQRYYIQYESFSMAQEVRRLKMELEAVREQLKADEKKLAALKQKRENHTGNINDTQWKRIKEKIIELARLKVDTTRNVKIMQTMTQGSSSHTGTVPVTMDIETPDATTEVLTEEIVSDKRTESIDNSQRNIPSTPAVRVQNSGAPSSPSSSPLIDAVVGKLQHERSPVFKVPELPTKKPHRPPNKNFASSVFPSSCVQHASDNNPFVSNYNETSETDTCKIVDFSKRSDTVQKDSGKQNVPAISLFNFCSPPDSAANAEYANFELNTAGFFTSVSPDKNNNNKGGNLFFFSN